jgi:thymidylate synthase (FAD)
LFLNLERIKYMNTAEVVLKHITPLRICSDAIRQCHQTQDKSDTVDQNIGPKDRGLIHRVGCQMKHESTLEHIVVSLDIKGISRALLQEWARTRHQSLTVQSSRYTLAKQLRNEEPFVSCPGSPNVDLTISGEQWGRASKYIVLTGEDEVDTFSIRALDQLRAATQSYKNDVIKYCMPESFRTNLTTTINFRSLRNMLALRTAPSALKEYRLLMAKIIEAIPEEYMLLLEDCIYTKKEEESNE